MNILEKKISFYKWKIPIPVFLWFLLATVAVLLEMSRGIESFNTFVLYRHVLVHTLEQHNLYVGQPFSLYDNHYGPFFSIVIAPFSFWGNYLGCFFWCIANAWVLYYAISKLPVSHKKKMMILLIAVVEMMTATHNIQFNTMLTGWIVLSFVMVEKEDDFWATFFVAAGILVKLYGIVGIAFFFFSKHKLKFVISLVFWLVILILLPMIISSPSFIIQSYFDWYQNLKQKNMQNIDPYAINGMQDISVMGMFRRIFNHRALDNGPFLLPAAIVYALPFLRIKQFKSIDFRLYYLALALIGVVIFSSSSESPTYVIAMVGVGIWYVVNSTKQNFATIALLTFTIIVTSLSPTDLFPSYIRNNYIITYSLKALPCFLIWIVIAKDLLFKNYNLKQAI